MISAVINPQLCPAEVFPAVTEKASSPLTDTRKRVNLRFQI
jgi:hypothetical protein